MATHDEPLTVRPISGALGAEVDGVDLSTALPPPVVAAIHQAFLDHQVLFFREQRLSSDDLKAFAGHFGDLYVHPYAKALSGHPEVMPVVREADEHGRNFGGRWHADLTFEEAPPLGSVLYALEVPPYGGDTVFASQYGAWDTLSPGLQATLGPLCAVHTADEAYGRGRAASARSMDLKTVDEAPEVIHPVVRVHPETGRPCLFLNALNTRRFEYWTEAESAPLLQFLFAHSIRPELTCRFRWSTGAVAFWDNRCVQHIALNDYSGRRREMHRVTICGDRPRGPAPR